MERDLRMIIVADTNTAEARQVIADLADHPTITQTVVTPALVRNIIPIRANPAIGVMFWSTDLQGMVADVEAFAAYIKSEADVKTAVDAMLLTAPDDVVLTVPDAVCMPWEAGKTYPAGAVVLRNGCKYRCPNTVTASEQQPPEMEGMLAIYRPIVPEHAGTTEDPIPWIYGMDCVKGQYYSYNEKTYLCDGDMIPCTWEPGTDGIWQWQEV